MKLSDMELMQELAVDLAGANEKVRLIAQHPGEMIEVDARLRVLGGQYSRAASYEMSPVPKSIVLQQMIRQRDAVVLKLTNLGVVIDASDLEDKPCQ